jgi:hypothetical protein
VHGSSSDINDQRQVALAQDHKASLRQAHTRQQPPNHREAPAPATEVMQTRCAPRQTACIAPEASRRSRRTSARHPTACSTEMPRRHRSHTCNWKNSSVSAAAAVKQQHTGGLLVAASGRSALLHTVLSHSSSRVALCLRCSDTAGIGLVCSRQSAGDPGAWAPPAPPRPSAAPTAAAATAAAAAPASAPPLACKHSGVCVSSNC